MPGTSRGNIPITSRDMAPETGRDDKQGSSKGDVCNTPEDLKLIKENEFLTVQNEILRERNRRIQEKLDKIQRVVQDEMKFNNLYRQLKVYHENNNTGN